jgi:hypothetical protein
MGNVRTDSRHADPLTNKSITLSIAKKNPKTRRVEPKGKGELGFSGTVYVNVPEYGSNYYNYDQEAVDIFDRYAPVRR